MADTLNLNTTYQAIVAAAKDRKFITYGDIAKAQNLEWSKVRYAMNSHLETLLGMSAANDWPLLTAIVVNQGGLQSGSMVDSAMEGFVAAAKRYGRSVKSPTDFVRAEQEATFKWAQNAPDNLPDQNASVSVPKGAAGPRFVQYFPYVLDLLRAHGGAAEPRDVYATLPTMTPVGDDEITGKTKGGQSKFENKVGWARFYLAKAGLIDGKKRGVWALTPEGRETYLDQESSLALFKDVQSRFKVKGSDDADDDSPAPAVIDDTTLFDDPKRRFWFVGAVWGDGTEDQTDRFVEEGIWQNGYDDKFSEHVQRMQVGDRIAIKASFTQKYNLPFDNAGKTVSCMRIKAIGTVTQASTDAKTVGVEWEKLNPPKEWYFYTYRVTVVEADASDDLARRLIQFTFGDHQQDYEFWLRVPYFAKKYRPKLPATLEPFFADEQDEAEADNDESAFESYDLDSIINEGCFLDDGELSDAFERLKAKHNLILQGPPGTGKTWLAKRLGYALIGTKDRKVTRKRLRSIQFHPSLSYEDFVRGWRPDVNGQLSLVDGLFLEAVEAARAEPDRPLVVVIEEINRGNPAQIFGEMLTLLERDKRREEEAIELAYRQGQGERVFIPDNLYVIGTMNIADRSLALVDLALRRRFAFVTLEPSLNDRWKAWCSEEGKIDDASIGLIQQLFGELNADIAGDRSLGPQFRIGHSYVTPTQVINEPREWLRQIITTEIAPLLEEYWYDNPDRAKKLTGRLLGAL
jgi:5-methylcytosine-specific restriction protein B